jgi:hypothetical protein
MYRSSAALVRYLAVRYGIPLDRTHIIGHDDIEGGTPAAASTMHWDPGPFWDWEHYMSLLLAPIRTEPGAVQAGDVVTITPGFSTNRQAIPSCSPAPCKNLPEQASNFLYLRTEPSADAPLISDAALQPGGQPGTRNAEDWGNKAVAGRRYVVAETRGDWVALWYSGQKAWLADPTHRLVGHSCETAVTLTPAPGLESIPVYGRAFPEADEYPAEVPAQVGIPLQYRIPAGQTYVAGEHIFGSRYYARFDEANVPLNHTLIKGKQEYVRVSLNHRWGWVKASDVTLNP